MLDIKQTAEKIYSINVEKGFWDKERNVGEMLMLVTSELSEALEADRKGKHSAISGVHLEELFKTEHDSDFIFWFKEQVKDTYEDELADAMIRLMDMAHGQGIEIESHILLKLRFNSLREKMHGKKY